MSRPALDPKLLRRACAALLLVLSTSCATAKTQQILYPAPPDKPRIAYVRSFTRQADLQKGFLYRVWGALVPHDTSSVLESPTGIALSPDERTLYVVSTLRARVIQVDRGSGAFSQFGVNEEHSLKVPIGVAVDGDGNVYVGDKGLDAIHVYDRNGKLTRFIGKGELIHPTAVAIDRRRQLLYVVNDGVTAEGRHTVEAYSLSGKHLLTIGTTRSTEPGSFNFPSDLAVSPSGELYVSDMLNFRVQVFGSDGHLVRLFGEPGTGVGLFDKIHGIAFDTFENIYIVDPMIGVQIFNEKAQPLMSFGRGVAQIPISIVIDSKNHILVTDYTNAVHEFELINTKAEDSFLVPPAAAPPPGDGDSRSGERTGSQIAQPSGDSSPSRDLPSPK